MKHDRNKVKEIIQALCSAYKLSYWEFIRPSKSPEYIKVRAILIIYLSQQGMPKKQIATIVNLDRSNVSRNINYAKTRLLTTRRGMNILRTIESLIFRQSVGVGLVFEQLLIERATSLEKSP